VLGSVVLEVAQAEIESVKRQLRVDIAKVFSQPALLYVEDFLPARTRSRGKGHPRAVNASGVLTTALRAKEEGANAKGGRP